MNFGQFPKTHLLAAAGLAVLVTSLTFALPNSDVRRVNELDTLPQPGWMPTELPTADLEAAPAAPESTENVDGAAVTTLAEQDAEPTLASDPVAVAELRTTEVRPGDSLSTIFKREGVSAQELHLLMTTDPLAKRLRNIFPGQQLQLTIDPDTSLTRFAYSTGPLQTLVFSRDGDRFVGEEINREPERIDAYKHGTIENSLFLASQRAGLNDAMTMRLAQIFQWDIDFVLDIRRGDEFSVLFEELYVEGEFIGYGEIRAAEFVNRGRHYQAVRYTDSHGDTHYYTPDGRPMRQAFLRAPVEFSRISSNFNMNRRHPLFNRNMPHRGIDYAAPTGTPILAAGDGRVMTASRTQPNGNYVVIQHGQTVTTKYLHLSRFAQGVKQGVRVRQGQVIGYVGATGWASGPHLHYEFLVNGVHQNPRTVKLPQAEPIPRNEIAAFREHAAPLLAALDNHKQQQQLALAQ